MTRLIGILILLFTTQARAGRAETLPATQFPAGEPIQRFFVPSISVDGIPVYRDEWRAWDGRNWIPLMTEEGQEAVFGIKPFKPELKWPPPTHFLKHQRRLE